MVKKLFLAFAPLLLLLSFSASPVQAADPVPATVVVESQGWWDTTGIVVPSRVGQHVHMQATIPTGVVSGTLNLPIKITLHNQTGKVTWVRACRQSSYCQTFTVSLGPCADCTLTRTIAINLNNWPTGVQELRLTANIPNNNESKRQFQSTGWPIKVRSATCSTRCNVFWEARGWYEGREYANARIVTNPWSIKSGGSVSVSLKPGSDGLPTKFSGLFIDPNFHAGYKGIWSKPFDGPFTGSVTLPTLSSGIHKLVGISSDGKNAGVQVSQFVVP